MKKILVLAALVLVVGRLVRPDGCGAAPAPTAEALFQKGAADAIRVVILKQIDEHWLPVPSSLSFARGDRIRVGFTSNFPGFAYIVNVTPGGDTRVLFPYDEKTPNSVQPGRLYVLPGADSAIEFDEEVGTEILRVIVARTKMAGHMRIVVDRLKTPTATSGLAPCTGKVRAGDAEMHSKGLFVSHSRKKESYVAVSDGGMGSRLGKGKVAVFDILLNHR